MSNATQDAFNDHADALRRLGSALEAATSVRYEAAPGSSPTHHRGGIPNPTLDIVLEPRRAAVGAAITRAAIALWPMTSTVNQHTDALHAAVAGWSGESSQRGISAP